MRGEHRTDAPRSGVDVGADDDRVRVDAAKHRFARPGRKRFDGKPEPLRWVAVAAAHGGTDTVCRGRWRGSKA